MSCCGKKKCDCGHKSGKRKVKAYGKSSKMKKTSKKAY